MGILQSKKVTQKEKHPFNKDIKHGTAEEPVVKKAGDTANTSQSLGPAQISHQMDPNQGNEAVLTRLHQVPAVDAPQTREQSIHKADRVQYIPHLPSILTQKHTSPAKPKDKPHDVPERISQHQSRPSKPVQHQKKSTAPVQQQANRRVTYSHTQHKESKTFTLSQPRPAAKETTEVPLQTVRTLAPCHICTNGTADCVHQHKVSDLEQVAAQVLCKDTSHEFKCSFGSKAQQETLPHLPASKMQAPVRRTYSEVVRGVTTENLQSKEAETQTKAKINKSSRVLSYVTESSTDSIGHATHKAHNIVEQSTTTPGIAQVPAVISIEPPDCSTQGSNQSKAQVINDKNEQCLELAEPGDDCKSSQHTSQETVNTVEESSQQQGCAAMEDNTIKTRNTLNPTTAAADTSVKLQLQGQDTAVRYETKCTNQNQPNNNTRNVTIKVINWKNGEVEKEKQEPGIAPAVPPENKDRAEGRWHPFTVNQSCSRKVRCRHNPGTGLPPNVQKWCDEGPNHLRDPPWVTTARFAACLAPRETQEEGGDSHQ